MLTQIADCDRCGHEAYTAWVRPEVDGGGLLTFCTTCTNDQGEELRVAGFAMKIDLRHADTG